MDELLQAIETRVRYLMEERQTLHQLNDQLKQNKQLLFREKEKIVAKHKSIVDQIENMVTRLKSIEELQ